MKARKVIALGCGTIFLLGLLGAAVLWHAMFGSTSSYKAGVPTHEFAPPSATSIDFFEARNISGVVAVTYKVGEEDFRRFAAEKGWQLSPKSGYMIVRSPSGHALEGDVGRNVDSCLFFERRHGNGGGITVVYIPAESRAYIDTRNR